MRVDYEVMNGERRGGERRVCVEKANDMPNGTLVLDRQDE